LRVETKLLGGSITGAVVRSSAPRNTLVCVDAWLTILGGLLAGLVGLGLFLVQHRRERLDAEADREREALVELAELLLPLLIEVERPLEARGYWVGRVREMRRLGTWIRDSAENAQKGPDWERDGSFNRWPQRALRASPMVSCSRGSCEVVR
jgi:hypothetical protein